MTFDEALDVLGKDESTRATIYAMNTLLIQMGVYTGKQFEELFCEYAENFKAGFAGKSTRAKATSHEAARANL